MLVLNVIFVVIFSSKLG